MIKRVLLRELRRIVKNPRYVILLTMAVVIAFTFFATMPRQGLPERLPVAVVDMDGTYLSRRVCHELNATQGVKVVAVYDNHKQARQAMQRGEIFAFYEIPQGTYNDLLQFKAPHFGLYSNTAYILAGNLSYRQLATLGMLAAGAVQREVYRKKGYTDEAAMGLMQPVEFDTHMIGNPWTNYQVYLMGTLLPAIIAFIALLHTVYVIGREQEEKTVKSWMRKAGGNSVKALIGKLLPYTVMYSLLALTANVLMFGPMHFPLEGSWLLLALTTVLLIIAVQGVGTAIACCLPDPPFAMGVTAVYGAMCFSLTGFSFPVEAMPRFFYGFSWLYPIRHYYLTYSNIAVFGNGLDTVWPYLAGLMGLSGLGLVGAWRMAYNYKKGILFHPSDERKSKREEVVA